MIPANRLNQLTRDIVLGRAKEDSATTPEEQEAWDRLAADIASSPGVVIDIPNEHPPEGYGKELWGEPLSDEQIAAAGSGTAPAAPAPEGETPPEAPADAPAEAPEDKPEEPEPDPQEEA